MFKRYWIIAIALGLALPAYDAIAQATTENEPGQEESTTDSNNGGQDNNSQTIDLTPTLEGIESAIRDLIAEEDKIAAEAQQQRENRDLLAQEGMARWAEWMFYATAFTAFLTLVALLFIFRTLHHTRRAADAAVKTVAAAEGANKAAFAAVTATEKIGFKQIRAYLSIQVDGVKDFEVGKTPYAKLIIRNAGQTPAMKVRSSSNINILLTEIAESAEFGEMLRHVPDEAIGTSTSVIPPNTGMGVSGEMFATLRQEDIAKIISGEVCLFVSGKVLYQDVFGKRQETLFCFVLNANSLILDGLDQPPTELSSGAFFTTPNGNDAT